MERAAALYSWPRHGSYRWSFSDIIYQFSLIAYHSHWLDSFQANQHPIMVRKIPREELHVKASAFSKAKIRFVQNIHVHTVTKDKDEWIVMHAFWTHPSFYQMHGSQFTCRTTRHVFIATCSLITYQLLFRQTLRHLWANCTLYHWINIFFQHEPSSSHRMIVHAKLTFHAHNWFRCTLIIVQQTIHQQIGSRVLFPTWKLALVFHFFVENVSVSYHSQWNATVACW